MARLRAAILTPHDILTTSTRHVFAVVPPGAPVADAIPRLRNDLRPRGQRFLERVVPTQAGALWLALVLALAVAVDFVRPRNPHNYELVLLLAPGVLFFDSIHFIELQSPDLPHVDRSRFWRGRGRHAGLDGARDVVRGLAQPLAVATEPRASTPGGADWGSVGL